jgi:sterol desaturase/sphingolipid hydroxylase (fatty acid hydroxylase superfamily)
MDCCIAFPLRAAGHAGYELSPFIPTVEGILTLMLVGLKGSKRLNTVQHHDMHHRYPSKHFSLYFTHWDRWMGTLHQKYDEQLFRYFS